MVSPQCVYSGAVLDYHFVRNLVTMAALIWFLPSVCSQMFFKITIFWKSFVTIATVLRWLLRWLFCDNTLLHWLHWYGFSPVCALRWLLKLLPLQKALSQCKILPTLATLVWLLCSMCLQIPFKLIILCEILVTMDTLVWLLPHVWPHIHFKSTFHWELTFVTDLR